MGLFSRFKRVLKSKLSKGLDKLEDPAEQLDYAYEELLGQQQKIEKAIRDVTADKNMIETTLEEHQQTTEQAHQKAKNYRQRALELNSDSSNSTPEGSEELQQKIQKYNKQARKALEARNKHQKKARQLKTKLQNSNDWLESIQEKRLDVQAKLDRVKSEKERLKSEWRMAQAESELEKTLTGLGDEVGDIDMTIARAREKIKEKRAMASASQEMIDKGLTEPFQEEEVPELEEETEGLLEGSFEELDQEIKHNSDLGPYLVVRASGGGTWAIPESNRQDFKELVDNIDEQVVKLANQNELSEEKFRELYSQIFHTLEQQGQLVGRDVSMKQISGEEEVLPQPDIELPPKNLELEEALDLLEGKDLITEWKEGEPTRSNRS